MGQYLFTSFSVDEQYAYSGRAARGEIVVFYL